MDKVLRPERLETDPNSSEASKEWLHWKRTFENFLTVLPQENLNKLTVLANYVSPTIFQYIEECSDYAAAIEILQALFVKFRNEIFARHLLATRRQQPNETLDEYLQALKNVEQRLQFQKCHSCSVHRRKYKRCFSYWPSIQLDTSEAA